MDLKLIEEEVEGWEPDGYGGWHRPFVAKMVQHSPKWEHGIVDECCGIHNNNRNSGPDITRGPA
jgi:hypothetical protein